VNQEEEKLTKCSKNAQKKERLFRENARWGKRNELQKKLVGAQRKTQTTDRRGKREKKDSVLGGNSELAKGTVYNTQLPTNHNVGGNRKKTRGKSA